MHNRSWKTGNGKSFTGTVFGEQGRKAGNSAHSITKNATIYDIGNDNFYLDTPGFDDFDEYMDHGENVWNNTIIVTKGDKIKNAFCDSESLSPTSVYVKIDFTMTPEYHLEEELFHPDTIKIHLDKTIHMYLHFSVPINSKINTNL
ncbi:37064_t:CDS:2, partial [Gigaspora margarita]